MMFPRILALPLLGLTGAVLLGQEVSLPASREKAVADLDRLVSPAGVAVLPEPALDPFSPPESHLREVVPPSEGKGPARDDADLLSDLIDHIKPTGSMMLNGEPYLLFTERRQKIGDKVPVLLAGVEYVVEIVSIANNRFRIRYNDKEAERTIK